ncbi:MAG TPA: sodium:solute symporter, partial [Pricia sp.]|nr:sodium:solute symporter [Pricia sp.]
ELNALGTITALDLYKRNKKGIFTERHYVMATKGFTLVWGLIAIGIASIANLFDNLIQLVNIIGSIFYGNVLGIFLLAMFFRFVKGNAVFFAAILTQLIIFVLFYTLIFNYAEGEEKLGYLWLNFIGSGLIIFIAFVFEGFDRLLKNPPLGSLNN